ncbi:MAG: glycosyltransferase family 8 protein [Vulcanimicrobiota bacterium]
MKQAEFQIVFATNLSRDLAYLAALTNSIVEHFSEPEKLSFHLLYYDLSDDELEPLKQSVLRLPAPMEIHEVSELVGKRKEEPGFGYWTWLWMQVVLPESLPRALYLDCDMLCYRDLRPLWDIDLTNSLAAAVADPVSRIGGYSQQLSCEAAELGFKFPPNSPYFNAGFLFANLEKWRERGLLEELDRYFQGRFEQLPFPDQDALNLVLSDQVIFLSPEWNLIEPIAVYENWDFELFSEFGSLQEYFEPRLQHFAGSLKPDRPFVRASHTASFLQHLEQAAWTGPRVTHKWYQAVIGNLLDFHYYWIRGIKQKAISNPYRRLLETVKRAPYTLVLYPFLPVYRLLCRLSDRFFMT